jgi:hypothetical protein
MPKSSEALMTRARARRRPNGRANRGWAGFGTGCRHRDDVAIPGAGALFVT